jgi:NADH dehydrogenase
LGVRWQLGVRWLNKRYVTSVNEGGVTARNGDGVDRIETATILWAAGVKGSPLAGKLAAAARLVADRPGRIPVTAHCCLEGFPGVFALVDMAACVDSGGQILPGVAPVAMQQGWYAAGAILDRLAHWTPAVSIF